MAIDVSLRPRAPLAILMRRRNAPGYEYVDTVYFNPYNGEYISTWRYGVNQSLGDWIIWSQVPLHFGTYWGCGVKIVWAAAGLAIPLLGVTGLLMYWNRALRRNWKKLRRAQTERCGSRPSGFLTTLFILRKVYDRLIGQHHYGKTTSASRDIASTIHPYTNLKLHETKVPLVITEGDGVFVRDEDGKSIWKGWPVCGASAWDFPSGVWPKPPIARC